jgi:hypothetical protein
MLDFNTTELSVRKAAATDALSSADLLTSLSHDPDFEVRRAVAGNPNTPTEVLAEMGKEFPDEITANPIFNILLLEDPESQFVRLSLARSSTISEAALTQLSSIGNEEILCAITQNPVTPLSILETLVHNPPQLYEEPEWSDYDRIFASVAKSPNVSVELLTELVERGGGVCYAIAENPKAPSKFLEQFATWRNIDMHRALMRNPKTPSSVLEILAGGLWPNIHYKPSQVDVRTHPNVSEMAINIANFIDGKPGTPVYVLERLAVDHRPEVRRLVAEHPSTSPEALEKLAQDKEQNIRQLTTHHPHLTSEALEKLTHRLVSDYLEALKYQSSDLRSWESSFLAILKHPNLTSKTVDSLLYLINLAEPNHRHAQSTVIEAILQHEKLLGSKLLELIQSSKGNLYLYSHTALAKNPNLTTEILEILIQLLLSLTPNEILASQPNSALYPIDPQTFRSLTQQFERRANDAIAQLITHPNILPERLEDFSTHDYDLIRKGVAQNPNTPIPVLQMLATHPTLGNRRAVAQNPNTPTHLLHKLAVDSNTSVRSEVAKNLHTPLVILETLVDDESHFIRAALAKNPSVSEAILNRLFKDPEEDVRRSLIDHPRISAQMIDFFVDELNDSIRESIIQHPNISVQTLLKLAEQECSGVRRSLFARGNSLPSVVLEKMTEVTLAQLQAKTDAQYRQDDEDTIINLIANHPNTPRHILAMFTTNQTVELHQRLGENWCSNFLYRSVASNISTPIDILEKLVSDPRFSNSGAREDARKILRHKF